MKLIDTDILIDHFHSNQASLSFYEEPCGDERAIGNFSGDGDGAFGRDASERRDKNRPIAGVV